MFHDTSNLGNIMSQNENHCSGSIAEFYMDTKIFITGATGFVGKTLLEKLLRSCEKIDSVFLLMRSKRGVAIEQRLKDLLKSPVFNILREKNPEVFGKIKLIPGDVSLPNLGLSDFHREFLIRNINIVLHSAATVKFNEKLKNAVILNTLSTRNLLQICERMKNLKSFVYISTAFSNADKQIVEETVGVQKYDADTVINLIETLPDELIDAISTRLIGKHPNTYTYTKALAEEVVLNFSSIIPTAIVRPSIITAASKEPYSGWLDNVSGITGILMECGRGTIRSILCNERCRIEIIPIDIVVNTVISSAWHVGVIRPNSAKIYNCTSGQFNPITWEEFRNISLKHMYEYPSKYVTWYPGYTFRTNRNLHILCTYLYHILPSYFLDLYLSLNGKQPIMLKLSRKFNQALQEGSFSSCNEWTFHQNSMSKLAEVVKLANDGESFNVDIRPETKFNWDEYIEDFVKGVRVNLLKDDMSTLNQARKKMNRLYWIQKIFQVILLFIACLVIGLYA